MGGKKTQRTKNNVKPSSSSRSAELLGAAVPSFVGFSAHSELGIVAFVPGFVTTEQLPESYDINISPQLQLILRKMSKKDPLTKQKALQELIELVNTSELDVVKSFLPLWPKFYQNLATDTEHNVRELAQTVLQLLVSKCKRAVAPTLKLIVPIWLVSHFDTYAPAASIARASFRETFTGTADRTCEVCLHCQSEIMDYTGRNLTFHTSSTLSNGKSLAPEEAEQKYQRVVIGSLKALSFFLEHTAEATDLSEAQSHILKLLGHPKFWSFAKHKVLHIKAAWFELLYHILQSPSMKGCCAQMKVQITTICFQNIHESDPVVAPQVWGCILQVQTIYEDWYLLIPLKDSILPKLSLLLRNGFNRNAVAISPNLLPFFSKMAHGNLPELDGNKFCKQFFDDIKASIMSLPSSSKSDLSAIIKAYFECLRYQFQLTNNAVECRAEYEALAIHLLNDNILEPIEAFLASDNVAAKPFFQHSSALVAFWADRQRGDASLYSHLLDTFWICVFRLITEGISNEAVHDRFLEHVLELIHDLQVANPSLEVASVKFADDSIADRQSPTEREAPASSSGASTALQSSASFIQEKLRQLVVQLVRLCLDNVRNERGSQYIGHVRRHMQMFADADFYAALTEERTIAAALDLFVQLLYTSEKIDGENNDEPNCAAEARRKTNEVVIEIIFEMMRSISRSDQFAYIRQYLLIIPHEQIQTLVLEQLLSYPLCIEPEVRSLLAEPTVCGFIANIASEIVAEHKKEELNLLHKCFFQTDDGEILIDATTVDIILEILSQPLIVPTAGTANPQLDDMVDACGSFIAQIMPVVCSHANASEGARRYIFLKLFRFTMERAPNDYISEDTFWEITTCWQDALSSDDIVIDRVLLEECAAAVEHGMLTETLTPVRIETMAEAVAKFVICATENVEDPGKRLQQIEEVMAALLRTARAEDETEQRAERHLEEYCALRETLKGAVTSAVELKNSGAHHLPLHAIFSRALINVSTLLKLVCKASVKEHRGDDIAIETGAEAGEEEEVTEDYCDPNEFLLEHWSESLFAELRKCIRIAAIGDSLISNETQVDPAVEALMLQLSECVRTLMRDGAGLAMQLSERMLQQACDDEAPTVCRPLLYLAFSEQYAQFEENAPILLNEALLEYFVPRNALCAYVNTLQYLLPQLLPRSISLQCAIMGSEPQELWLRAAMLRCLVSNNFNAAFNKKDDKAIITATLDFVTHVAERQHAQRDMLLYNIDLRNVAYSRIVDTTEYINLLVEIVKRFPHELDIKHWDTVRIGLSSWMLTASQSIDGYAQPKIAAFVGSVARLFVALSHFVVDEKSRSSTELLASVVDEWQSLFARDVNLVLFKAFFKLARLQDAAGDYIDCYVAVLDEVISAIELIHYGVVYAFCSHSEKITLDTLCNFLLKNLSNPVHSVRTCCVYILHHLTQSFVAADIAIFEKKNEALLVQQQQSTKWHFLNRFEDYIGRYSLLIQKYLNEFSFKLSEIPDLTPIDRHEGLSYLLLWDCIVYACANAPVTLRSLYTNWLHEHKYEENLLLFLFRAMPADVLRNHDSKLANHSDIFRALTFAQIKDRNLSLERYTCHMYAEVLRKLPAVVRRWWNTCPSRQKTFVDKLTTQFVSTLICNDELRSIANIKDKLENMQVTVHTSTREVLAMYTIDEVRMELVITLSPNYPLGAVKVDCGKQIGNKSASRNFSMQLTIFLTHQNGTIYDGLTMWKNNLDKKFEGVEECYVCYTVIHQDTCQLPKLTCKTCKKKFHGPCLFKWFTTSSKSTCPICRNIF